MDANKYARGMAAYNTWMNHKLYTLSAELSDEERKRDLGAFFGSLHRTLNHLVVGDDAWMQRVHGEPVTMTSPAEERYTDFDTMWQARRALDTRIERWAEGVTDAFTRGVVRFWSVTYQRELELPGWAVLVQIFNHETHHRGQATTLLKQLGKDPGATDLPMMPGLTEI
jgi:uncharacterized damage-inducible protein DinB